MDAIDHFNKEFQFPSIHGWKLPDTNSMFDSKKWHVPEMLNNKRHLNIVKGNLNNYPLNKWHKHTSRMNPSGLVLGKVRHDFDICFITQAWCKLYETISTYDIIPEYAKTIKQFNSVHLCEAPGGFVAALNHYLVSKEPELKWKWMATSLNPHYEGNERDHTIMDDRVILSTYPYWTFGADNTGDILKIENMRHIESEVIRRGLNKAGALLLVTADGSIDCQNTPGEQEEAVSNLLFCETVTALRILDPGGSYVLKTFTMFECNTISLFYILVCAFSTVRVWKPATSREGNSEVYVVCLHYHGKETLQPWLDVFCQHYGNRNDDTSIFPEHAIPKDFITELIKCSGKFLEYQVDAIKKNISTFTEEEVFKIIGRRNPSEQYEHNALRKAVAAEFIFGYKVEAIPMESQIHTFEDKITQGKSLKWLSDLYEEQNDLTFALKTKERNLKERLQYLHNAFKKSFIVRNCFQFDSSNILAHNKNDFMAKFCEVNPYIIQENQDMIFGKRMDEVRISKFCHVWYLDMLERMKSLLKLIKQSRNAHTASEGNESMPSTSSGNVAENRSLPSSSSGDVAEGSESMPSTSSGNVAAGSRSLPSTVSGNVEGNETIPSVSARGLWKSKYDESPSNVGRIYYLQTNCKKSEIFESYVCPSILLRIKMLKILELSAFIKNQDYQILHWSINKDIKFSKELINVLQLVNCNGNLLVLNPFPLLKQFDVGCLYLLGLLFKEMYFIWPDSESPNGNYGILFTERHLITDYKIDVRDYLVKVVLMAGKYEKKNTEKDIISVVPIKLILEKESFYECVMSVNQIYLERECKGLLKNCEEELA